MHAFLQLGLFVSIFLSDISEGSSVCMANSAGISHSPSLYEQYCCVPSNSGKKFKVTNQNTSTFILCPTFSSHMCSKFFCSSLQTFPTTTSGYYNITLRNGSRATVYCNMNNNDCDGKGGWTRVGYINMSDSGTNNCPRGLNSYDFPNISYRLCDRPHPSSYGCDSTYFSTFDLKYSQVCGRVRGYQYNGVDDIYQNNGGTHSLEGPYVDGISITHGSNPRRHIWTFVAGQDENDNVWEDCPCNTGSSESTPQYVGNDYYCESGVREWNWNSDVFFHYDDPLWDGKQCGYLESDCCTTPNIPWFIKSFNYWTTDDIELRMCSSEGYPNEATPIDIIELYIR